MKKNLYLAVIAVALLSCLTFGFFTKKDQATTTTKTPIAAEPTADIHNRAATAEQPKATAHNRVAPQSPKQIDHQVYKQNKLYQKIEASFQYFFDRMKNPVTGAIPDDMVYEGLMQTKRLQEVHGNNRAEPLEWKERGPDNVGGRTRAILVDVRDPSRKTVFAGSVSGGLWKTTDITAAKPIWTKINDNLENLAVGALAQDPKNPEIMYMGTGEGYPNADAMRGVGIFKSVDGGNTWNILPSTRKVTNFAFVQRLVFNPITNDLFAGTGNGLFRSSDGGATWSTAILSSKIFDLEWSPAGYLVASNASSIYKINNTTPVTFTNLTIATNSGFIKGLSRVEFTICKKFPNVIYAIGNLNGAASLVMKSSDGGVTWVTKGNASSTGGDITNGQVWYDLTICVAPSDSNRLWVGGVPVGRSIDGANTFTNITGSMHVDQHITMFDPNDDNVLYFGNDGGIYRCANPLANTMTIENKEFNYNTSQFYAVALHPDSLSNYFLGGTQDNNSMKMNGNGISSATVVRGGDGMFCHIDQKDPKYQMACSQNANYSISTNGGQTWGSGFDFKGNWAAASDYDSFNGIMYTQSGLADLYEWRIRAGLPPRRLKINGTKTAIEALLCDPNKAGRLYIGTSGGRITVIEEAVQVDTFVTTANLTLIPGGGTVGSIEVEPGNENHMLVAVTNTGLANNIWESFDRGKTWVGVEGTAVSTDKKFPDIPVWWATFVPGDATKAIIATEFGVWNTELLDGANTTWIPPSATKGTPLVRTKMLQFRNSDKVVLAGTYGRGMWTTDNFSPVVARLAFEKVTYLNTNHSFTNLSSNGKSFVWDFGDGATSTEENPTHSYSNIGVYPVTLKVNGSTTISSTITVLPDRPLPYQNGTAAYGGNFDGFSEQYAVDTKSGSAFEKGNSTKTGKSGTKSGANAFVLGINEDYYQPNTDTRLYLPNFNMKDAGIYEFSFWAKHQLHGGTDGFIVEYSLDRGQKWQTLGQAQPGWYNATSTGGAFVAGVPFFTNTANNFTKYVLNISSLSGNENVAFRIVFRSEDTGLHAGVAIDDVEISKYDGPLETIVIKQAMKFNSPTELQIDWTTLPEYFCKQFDLELSTNGVDFLPVKKVNATGVLTANQQSYAHKEVATKCVYFARIKVTNENLLSGYSKVFYTPLMSVKRDNDCGNGIYEIFPNPFDQKINITFTELKTGPFKLELFDDTGRLLKSTTINLANQATVEFLTDDLPKGVYLLRTQLGSEETKTYKLVGGIK